ncbi:hypothetical protein MTO96_006534 [Rhipicephalus appendiculatus]
MAGNFWQSSQYQQWLLDRQDLLRERHGDLQVLSEEEYHKLMIFFANFIQALGEQLKVKQQVIATATVYFKRFYVRNSLRCVDPLLMAPTCIFLASKVEEFGVISNSRLVTTCQTVVKNKFSHVFPQDFPYRINHVLECEFYLLEMMDCCLVLYHPYRPLVQYVHDIGPEDSLLSMAWKVVNDSLRTDVCLLHPPHQIALACLHVACVILQRDCKHWFAGPERRHGEDPRNHAPGPGTLRHLEEHGREEGAAPYPSQGAQTQDATLQTPVSGTQRPKRDAATQLAPDASGAGLLSARCGR